MSWTERYVSSLAGGGGSGVSESDPWTWVEGVANYATAERVNVKADGDYNLSSFTLGLIATTHPGYWRAYRFTPGDGGLATLNMNSGSGITYSGNSTKFDGFLINTDLNGYPLSTTQEGVYLYNCHLLNTHAFGSGVNMSSGGMIARCTFDTSQSTSTSRISVNGSNFSIVDSKILAGAGTAVNIGGYARVIGNSLVGTGTSGTLKGVSKGGSASLLVYGNSFHGMGSAVEMASGALPTDTYEIEIINNTIWGVNRGIFNAGGTNNTKNRVHNNSIGGASVARYAGLGDTPIHDDIILDSDPFLDSANGDLRLNSVADGGARCINQGLEAPR